MRSCLQSTRAGASHVCCVPFLPATIMSVLLSCPHPLAPPQLRKKPYLLLLKLPHLTEWQLHPSGQTPSWELSSTPLSQPTPNPSTGHQLHLQM